MNKTQVHQCLADLAVRSHVAAPPIVWVKKPYSSKYVRWRRRIYLSEDLLHQPERSRFVLHHEFGHYLQHLRKTGAPWWANLLLCGGIAGGCAPVLIGVFSILFPIGFQALPCVVGVGVIFGTIAIVAPMYRPEELAADKFAAESGYPPTREMLTDKELNPSLPGKIMYVAFDSHPLWENRIQAVQNITPHTN